MGSMTVMKATFEDGREAQFQEMMQQLTQLQGKYKGVRGELLAKVREEFERLKPTRPTTLRVAPPPPPTPSTAQKMLPSCRMCGRGMKLNEAEGTLVCEKGHSRPAQASAP